MNFRMRPHMESQKCYCYRICSAYDCNLMITKNKECVEHTFMNYALNECLHSFMINNFSSIFTSSLASIMNKLEDYDEICNVGSVMSDISFYYYINNPLDMTSKGYYHWRDLVSLFYYVYKNTTEDTYFSFDNARRLDQDTVHNFHVMFSRLYAFYSRNKNKLNFITIDGNRMYTLGSGLLYIDCTSISIDKKVILNNVIALSITKSIYCSEIILYNPRKGVEEYFIAQVGKHKGLYGQTCYPLGKFYLNQFYCTLLVKEYNKDDALLLSVLSLMRLFKHFKSGLERTKSILNIFSVYEFISRYRIKRICRYYKIDIKAIADTLSGVNKVKVINYSSKGYTVTPTDIVLASDSTNILSEYIDSYLKTV